MATVFAEKGLFLHWFGLLIILISIKMQSRPFNFSLNKLGEHVGEIPGFP